MLDVGAGRTQALFSKGRSDNMTRDFSAVHLAEGLQLNLSAESWNTVWNFRALTGSGDIKRTATTNHWYSSRLILDGDNNDNAFQTILNVGGNMVLSASGTMFNNDVTVGGRMDVSDNVTFYGCRVTASEGILLKGENGTITARAYNTPLVFGCDIVSENPESEWGMTKERDYSDQ